MQPTRRTLAMIALGTSLLALPACASRSDLDAYATKNDLNALRNEMMTEMKKAQDSARASELSAKESADKADAIFRRSLRK